MKARSFLTALGATVLVLLFTVVGLWWTMARNSPLRLADQSMELPRSAQFVPKQAALSLHWLMDPSRLPDYAQAVAPTRRRQDARDGIQALRDGFFALAGFDFETELADWLGPHVSVALLDPDGASESPGWVLALSSRDDKGARRFLQRFWQSRSLAGMDLQISHYRGMGLISGRGAFLGSDLQPLATALIDDDLLLLASGRGVLEQALDASQFADQHQLGDPSLANSIATLGDGIALLTASPAALQTWFGLPARTQELDDLQGLVALLRPQGAQLGIEAQLSFLNPRIDAGQDPHESLSILNAARGPAEALAILSKPSRFLDATNADPLVHWLSPHVKRLLFDSANSPEMASGSALSDSSQKALLDKASAASIVALDDGPLLWLQQPRGWLLGTFKDHPELAAVDEALVHQGLARSELVSDGEDLAVWTRLERNGRSKEKLEAQLGLVMSEENDTVWWGQNLTVMQQRQDAKSLDQRLVGLHALQDPSGEGLPNALSLASQPARNLLRDWRPWELMQALAGYPLQSSVQSLSIAVGPDPDLGVDQDQKSSALRLRAQFSFG